MYIHAASKIQHNTQTLHKTKSIVVTSSAFCNNFSNNKMKITATTAAAEMLKITQQKLANGILRYY